MSIPIPSVVEQLVELFDRNKFEYKSSSFKEAHLRQQFINPFWEALGWDMTNRKGYAEYLKEVVHEDSLKIQGSSTAPDYTFRAGPQRKFFLEVKAPKVFIKEEVPPSYQLKRYAWSANLPLSVLSDFEEFAVYQCTARPKIADKPAKDRIEYFTYTEYIDRWDWIYERFSREAVWSGKFDAYASTYAKRRGTATFDKAFLADMLEWRKMLAQNIALRNKDITERELNFAVTATLDRIIFLRIAEDRGIDTYGNLAVAAGLDYVLEGGTKKRKVENVYKEILKRFSLTDEKYNSGLFHFRKEKDRPSPDNLTPRLTIDDKVITEIIKSLYYPESPYAFDQVPADILGNVYEQFLGQIITLSPSHKASIDFKPEVKKAGGVYYTPKYIVDYIVKNTLGKLLDDIYLFSGSGDRAPGSGSTNPDPGSRTPVPEKINTESFSTFESKNDKELQRTGSLEDGNGPGGRDVRSGGHISTEREIRIEQPNPKSSSLSTLEHSRGLGKKAPEGVPSSSVDRVRIADGSGNANALRNSEEIRHAGADESILGSQYSNGPDAQQTDASAEPNSRIPDTGSRTTNTEHKLSTKQVSDILKQARKVTVLDPACGSGSFLLGAYQYLLDWYHRFYIDTDPTYWNKQKVIEAIPARSPDPGSRTPNNRHETKDYRLTIAERKRILLNHIHGVDIDSQAVEVAKLNLLLKASEGTAAQGQLLYDTRERLLPDLEKNIICGNSLIGWDYFGSKDRGRVRTREELNPLDYDQAFPEIVKDKGFDVVIGNPPYRMLQPHNTDDYTLSYLRKKYLAADFKVDFFHLFIQRAFDLMKPGAEMGFIIPATLLNNVYVENLRQFLANHAIIRTIAVASEKVFEGADVHAFVLMLQKPLSKDRPARNLIRTTAELSERFLKEGEVYGQTPQTVFNTLEGKVWNILLTSNNLPLIGKIHSSSQPLSAVASINRGLITGDRDKYFSATKSTREHVPILTGADVRRFYYDEPKEFVLFQRPKTSGGCWDPAVHHAPHKVIVRQIGKEPTAAFLDRPIAVTGNVFTVMADAVDTEIAITGILNSKLIAWYWSIMFADFKATFPQVTIFSLSRIPVPVPGNDLKRQMVELTTQASKLAKQSAKGERELHRVTNELDRLVYALYGLSEEEIRIVEGN